MNSALVQLIIQALLTYGPAAALAIKGILTKANPSQADFDAVFAAATQENYDAYIAAAKQKVPVPPV